MIAVSSGNQDTFTTNVGLFPKRKSYDLIASSSHELYHPSHLFRGIFQGDYRLNVSRGQI